MQRVEKLMVEKLWVEKYGVDNFMVEKSGVEKLLLTLRLKNLGLTLEVEKCGVEVSCNHHSILY